MDAKTQAKSGLRAEILRHLKEQSGLCGIWIVK